MNLSKDRGEDCTGKIINLIQNDLKTMALMPDSMLLTRVRKLAIGKTRLIIARFVFREDRDVWLVVKEKRSEKFHNLSGCLHHARQNNMQDNAKTIQQVY